MSYQCAVLEDGRKAGITASQAVEYDLPNNFTISLITITMQGDCDTDAVTFAEILAQMGTIEVITTRGGEIYIEAEDLYPLSGYLAKGEEGVVNIGAAADKECALTVYIPLGITARKWFAINPVTGKVEYFGLPGHLANKLRVSWGTDTGINSRDAIVQVEGYSGIKPKAYQVFREDSYTSVANAFKTQKISGAGALRGVFGFTTSNFNVDTGNVELGVKEVNVWLDEKPVLEAFTLGKQMGAEGVQADDPAGGTGSLDDTHWLWNLDPSNMGLGMPIQDNMKVANKGGTAEAVRVYPLIYRRV